MWFDILFYIYTFITTTLLSNIIWINKTMANLNYIMIVAWIIRPHTGPGKTGWDKDVIQSINSAPVLSASFLTYGDLMSWERLCVGTENQ